MLKRGSHLTGAFLVAGLLFAAGEAGVSVAGAGQTHARAAPGDLLSDAYDALSEDRADLARKIFQTLLNAYPHSTEAARAADELAALESAGIGPDGSESEDTPDTGLQDQVEERNEQPSDGATPPRAARPTAKGPAAAEALQRARYRFLTDVGDRVFFAENSDALGGRARATLEAQARWLKAAGGFDLTIIGRAADGGSAGDNRALALARAQAVQAKLVEAGVAPERIRVDSRGSDDPVATCTQPLCEAHNRHVESLLRYPGMETSQRPVAAGKALAGGASREAGSRRN